MGFCLFNSVAVGAAHALRGARAVAGRDRRLRRAPRQRHRGDLHRRSARADGVDVPASALSVLRARQPGAATWSTSRCAPGSGGAEFRAAVTGRWLPALEKFRPQMILISAGFDAHREDPLAGLKFVEADYAWVTRELMAVARRHAQGRIVSSLEGGYATVGAGTQRRRARARAHRRMKRRQFPMKRRQFLSTCALLPGAAALAAARRVGGRDAEALSARAARGHPRRADPPGGARRRHELRVPVSVRGDAVLPAPAVERRWRAAASCGARTAARTRGRAASARRATSSRSRRSARTSSRTRRATSRSSAIRRSRRRRRPATSSTAARTTASTIRRPARAWSPGRRRSRSRRSCSSTTRRATGSAALGTVGPEQFDAFFAKYDMKLSLEYGCEGAPRRRGHHGRARARRTIAARRSHAGRCVRGRAERP